MIYYQEKRFVSLIDLQFNTPLSLSLLWSLSEVTMRILGSLPNGNVIDKHNSLRFIVSDGDVVQGKYSLSSSFPLSLPLCLCLSLSLCSSLSPSLPLFISSFPFISFHILFYFAAVDIVVSLMQRGEICCVKADSKYAYGPLGRYTGKRVEREGKGEGRRKRRGKKEGEEREEGGRGEGRRRERGSK